MSPRNAEIVSSSSESSTAPILTGVNFHDGGSSDSSGHVSSRITVDLVTAGRRFVSFLRALSGSPLLRHATALLRSIQRYEEIWMPLISDLGKASSPAMLLPPPDVNWIWYCHCLNPLSYREYCTSRFGALVDRPAIFDEESEEYAVGRCREIWSVRYPCEPFDLEIDEDEDVGFRGGGGDLFAMVDKHRSLHSYFSDPFVSETVYLVSARCKYFRFLHFLSELGDGGSRIVPTSDILLMWLTHQIFPMSYQRDTEALGDLGRRVVGFGELEIMTGEVEETTRRAWEKEFNEPYELAGSLLHPTSSSSRVFFNWEPPDADVNRRYKGLTPRFLMEVFVFLKGKWEEKEVKDASKTFLRIRTVRCHREMKMERPISNSSFDTWSKTWHLYCEFGTRGIVLEVRQHSSSCLRNSKLLKKIVFLWNDLLRSTSLNLTRELQMQVRAMSSITPPVQGPYLLRCVPDRVTDDVGAMVSDVILRMNEYRPQRGRWLSRTVLDHARRECFVIRIRVGRGIWRRGAEIPSAVKWEDRIIEIREGPWSYVANSVGSAPEKVVGTAHPVIADSQEKAIWHLSTGDVTDVLTIQWEDGLNFHLENGNSSEPARLLRGRKLQYQGREFHSDNIKQDDDHYITLTRSTPDHPEGRATALINWKLLAVEFSPEEDAVFILLLCVAVVRTISEVRREDVGGLLVSKRTREVKAGIRDWGSLMLPPPFSCPHLEPWYWDAEEVLDSAETVDSRHQIFKYSPVEGKEELYRKAIVP